MAYRYVNGSVSEIIVTRTDDGFRLVAQTKFPGERYGNELPNLFVKNAADVGANVIRMLNETYQQSQYYDEHALPEHAEVAEDEE